MSWAPSDEGSGLSFVVVIILPLLVNIHRFTCNVHVRDIYAYIKYVQGLCQSRLRTADHACSFSQQVSQSQSHVTTDDQSVSSKSWFQGPCGSHDQIFISVDIYEYCFTDCVRPLWYIPEDRTLLEMDCLEHYIVCLWKRIILQCSAVAVIIWFICTKFRAHFSKWNKI
jgi:hypothetical protein